MWAFILSGLIVVATLVLSFLVLFSNAMSDTTGNGTIAPAVWTFGIGISLAALVASSHWWPNIGW